jgi:hypothetical protein
MTIKDLIKLLKKLDQDKEIQIVDDNDDPYIIEDISDGGVIWISSDHRITD